MKGIKWVLLGLLVSAVWAAGVAAKEPGTMAQPVPADLPLIDLAATGFQAVAAPAGRQPVSAVPPAVSKTAVSTAAPGQEVVYTVTLRNSGPLTQTVTLTDVLPPQVELVAADSALAYNPADRTLHWTGEIPPGQLDYSLTSLPDGLPYLDLGGYGLPNLCDPFIAAGGDCDETAVTFNLGAEGYSVSLYGRRYEQIRVSANGLLFLDETPTGDPHWLPTATAPGLRLAGLWQDLDLTSGGRWHAAILSGYLAGQEVFYAQWQDAPHAANPDLTSRFAIALTVDRQGHEPAVGGGEIFYLYDHISQPDALIAAGYAIGLQDSAGQRGFTYAYAGPDAPPRSFPPAPGTTLRWQPHFYGSDYSRSFAYRVRVTGGIPETAVNTATTTWSDGRSEWATHYLAIRHQTYLPLLFVGGAGGR
ncbi:MAG: DUF11 domain-containing protein [Chloroflexi bacterium]|nr:DUF11 domain-containing protein [Chloroflexota bacterium]